MKGTDNPQRVLVRYVSAGMSPTEALDLYMVKDAGMSAEAWASIRGRTTRAIEKNIGEVADRFEGVDVEEVLA